MAVVTLTTPPLLLMLLLAVLGDWWSPTLHVRLPQWRTTGTFPTPIRLMLPLMLLLMPSLLLLHALTVRSSSARTLRLSSSSCPLLLLHPLHLCSPLCLPLLPPVFHFVWIFL